MKHKHLLTILPYIGIGLVISAFIEVLNFISLMILAIGLGILTGSMQIQKSDNK